MAKNKENNKEKDSVEVAQAGKAVKPSNILEAKIEAKIFRELFKTIGSVVNEAPIEITEDGLHMQTMDPSHVAMLVMDAKKEMFEEYNFKAQKPKNIGINVDQINTILNRAKTDDVLVVRITEEKMDLAMVGETKRKFSMRVLDTLEGVTKIPELASTATIKINADVVKDAIMDAGIIGDAITFVCNKGFRIEAENEDHTNDFSMVVSDEGIKEYDLKKECRSTFNLDYLKVSKHWDGDITLKLGEDIPIVVDFNVDKASFEYILAPRVERE